MLVSVSASMQYLQTFGVIRFWYTRTPNPFLCSFLRKSWKIHSTCKVYYPVILLKDNFLPTWIISQIIVFVLDVIYVQISLLPSQPMDFFLCINLFLASKFYKRDSNIIFQLIFLWRQNFGQSRTIELRDSCCLEP